MKYFIYSSFMLLVLIGCQTSQNESKTQTVSKSDADTTRYKTIGSIERLDSSINELISPEAKLEILAEGFQWSEGPLWIEDGKYLLFTDVPADKIYKWSAEKGLEVYLEPSGFTGDSTKSQERGANGLILAAQGKLVMCQHGNRQVASMKSTLDKPNSEFESLAASYEGKRLNSPNDLVFDSQGNLYFTDPPYGLAKKDDEYLEKELPYQGIFLLDKARKLHLLNKELSKPNGIALSLDEKTLYVANSDPKQALLMAYPIEENGKIGKGRIFYNFTEWVEKEKGLPDGLKIDKKGNIYTTAPGGVWIISPEGKVLGKIKTEQATANCAFNADKTVLYITAHGYLMRLRLQ